jgi:hypothetical protein
MRSRALIVGQWGYHVGSVAYRHWRLEMLVWHRTLPSRGVRMARAARCRRESHNSKSRVQMLILQQSGHAGSGHSCMVWAQACMAVACAMPQVVSLTYLYAAYRMLHTMHAHPAWGIRLGSVLL